MFQFKLWLESLKTKDFIEKTPIAVKVSNWLFSQPQIRSFLSDVDESSIIKPLSVGKTGVLVLSKAEKYQPLTGIKHYDSYTGNSFQHRIPVKIKEINDGQIQLERTDGKDFSEIAYKVPYFPVPRSRAVVELPLSRIILVDPEKYQTYLNWITYAVTKGAQDNKSKIPSYFNKFWTVSENGLRKSLSNPGIISQLRTTDLKPDHFASVSVLPIVNKDHRGGVGGAGRTFITFENGFKWVSLDRKECRKEADAGGHCGNTADSDPNDNVLSLRDKDNRVYLTFIINNGVMGEMKANGNKKPHSDLHPYIIKLLEDPMVKQIGSARYMPENNFNITDLDYENLIRLGKSRPDLANVDKFDISLIKNRNNINKFLKRLEKKYPHMNELNIRDYDFNKRAFRLNQSEVISGYHGNGPEWHSTVWQIINTDALNMFHALYLINEHFEDLPPEALIEFSKYFLDNIKTIKTIDVNDEIIEKLKSPKKLMTHELFNTLLHEFRAKDKNVKHVLDLTYVDAYRKTIVEKINEELKHNKNESGIFYQIDAGKFKDVIATKYISKNDMRSFLKYADKITTEIEHINLNWIEAYPRYDIFMNMFSKNIKYLHYKIN